MSPALVEMLRYLDLWCELSPVLRAALTSPSDHGVALLFVSESRDGLVWPMPPRQIEHVCELVAEWTAGHPQRMAQVITSSAAGVRYLPPADGFMVTLTAARIGGVAMKRPVMLDLYCCEGGAARGYQSAGFDVFGVDLDRKYVKRYAGDYIATGDALAVLGRLLDGVRVPFYTPYNRVERPQMRYLTLGDVAAVHASPRANTPAPGRVRSGREVTLTGTRRSSGRRASSSRRPGCRG